jgi:hypothetical protein
MRLRILLARWPRRALVLMDTPRPNCPDCEGDGEIASYYGDSDGEDVGTEWGPCPCWNRDRRWVLLPLPLPRIRIRRRAHGPVEPPF